MLAEERFLDILNLVNQKHSVTVQELTDLLNISISTIRRDLTVLHDRGQLVKIHGGAAAVNMSYDTMDRPVSVRQNLNMDDKNNIAQYAASLIMEDDFVFLDAGTTTDLLVKFINQTDAVVGSETICCLKKYNFTKGFWGTNGITFKEGFTTPDLCEALVKKAAMEQSLERYIVSDSSKFNQIASVIFYDFENALIITRNLKDSSYRKAKNILEVS